MKFRDLITHEFEDPMENREIEVTVRVRIPKYYSAPAENVGREVALEASTAFYKAYDDVGLGSVSYVDAVEGDARPIPILHCRTPDCDQRFATHVDPRCPECRQRLTRP